MNPDLPEWISSTAEFVVSWPFIVVYCGGILLYGVAFFVRLMWKSRRLAGDLKQAVHELERIEGEEAFARRFNSVDQIISKLPTLGHTWREYTESLIHPDPGGPAPTTLKNRIVVLNTRMASDYFHEDAVIRPAIDVRYYSSIPNHLTALGILGTFIGLAAGIWLASRGGMAGGDIEAAQRALQDLLDGASLAFFTSIAGLFTSLVFLIAERKRFSSLHASLDKWNRALDARLELTTPEKLWHGGVRELEAQTAELKRFNSELATSIGAALDESLAKSISPVMERMLEAFQSLTSDQRSNDQAVLQHVVQELGGVVERAAGKQLQSIAGTLTQLDGTLSSSVDVMKQTQSQMLESTTRMSESVEKAMVGSSTRFHDDLHTAVGTMLDELKTATQALSEELSRSGRVAAESVNSSASVVQNQIGRMEAAALSVERLLTGLDDAVQTVMAMTGQLATTHDHMQQVMPTLTTSARQFSEAGAAVSSSVDRLEQLGRSNESSVRQIAEAQNALRQVWQEYQVRFENVDQSLARVFAEMDTGLKGFGEQISGYVRQIDEHLGRSVETLAGGVRELSEVVEDLGEKVGG